MKELPKKSNLGTSGKKKTAQLTIKTGNMLVAMLQITWEGGGGVDGQMNIGDASEIISINENCLYCILIFRD